MEVKDEGVLMDLHDMVEYQERSVVSRAVVSTGGGSVTLFAFDSGETLSEHTAPYDALVQVFEGSADITVDGRCSRVKSGQMILMPAGRPHAVAAPERFKMMLVMIKGG